MWSQCKALPCAALSWPVLTLQYCHLPQCASKAVAVLRHKFSCLNDTVFFFSCQVRLRGPKLLEHSLATTWHQFESFHQFLFTDATGSTTNQCKTTVCLYCHCTLYTKPLPSSQTQIYNHNSTKHVHSSPYSISCRRWTQMGLTAHV